MIQLLRSKEDHAAQKAPVPYKVVADWLVEEAAELGRAALDSAATAALDALFDALGVILVGLLAHDAAAVQKGYEAYASAQTARGRPPNSPHQVLIKDLVARLATVRDADGSSAKVLATRADRYTDDVRSRTLASVADIVSRVKATQRKPEVAR